VARGEKIGVSSRVRGRLGLCWVRVWGGVGLGEVGEGAGSKLVNTCQNHAKPLYTLQNPLKLESPVYWLVFLSFRKILKKKN